MRVLLFLLFVFALVAIFLGSEFLIGLGVFCVLGIAPLILFIDSLMMKDALKAKRKADLERYNSLKAKPLTTPDEEQWMRLYENGLYWAAVGRGEIKHPSFDI